MTKVVKLFKTVKNNWKKSVFLFGVALYGFHYASDKYRSFQLMRQYCEEALQYGEMPVMNGSRPRQITVILNPVANNRKSRKNYDKYCAPLLNLAGISVNVIQTEFEGQARDLVESLDGVVDAIVVAGGDGTVSEAVTGLLRRADGDLAVQRKFPIGVLPLGRTNTVATSLFLVSDRVKMMSEATMAIIKEMTKPIDVIKIEVLETQDEHPGKPVYCLGGIQWGAYRDANAKKDKYWYWGMLRSYVTYIFMGLKSEESGVSWQCKGHLSYIVPCKGCSRCVQAVESDKSRHRWWHVFLSRQRMEPGAEDYSKVINEQCGTKLEKEILTVDLSLTTANISPNCIRDGDPHIEVAIGPSSVSFIDFVTEGWKRVNGEAPRTETVLKARELEIRPVLKNNTENTQHWLSIDNEDYEVKPVHATLLPKKVHMFYKPTASLS
jgi:acylglycerol kinase